MTNYKEVLIMYEVTKESLTLVGYEREEDYTLNVNSEKKH